MRKLHLLQVLITIQFAFSICKGSRILAVEFFGGKSHLFTYLPLLEELHQRGHNVTLVSPVKGYSKPDTIREIVTIDFEQMANSSTMLAMGATNAIEIKEKGVNINPFVFLTEMIPKACVNLYDREDIQGLMEDEDFDLVFVQPLFNDCSLGFIHRIMERNKAPLILFTPTSPPNFLIDKIGGHHPPSYISNAFLGLKQDMSFQERMMNMGMNVMLELIFYFLYTPIMESTYRYKLGQDIPSSKEILNKASLLLSNSHFSLSGGKPNFPNVVDVGGIHSRGALFLPQDLDDFVSGSGKDGFILFSLGTGIKSSDMSQEKRKMILNVFSKLKQKVVWKYEEDDDELLKMLPKNILLVKWLPQQDLLGHPKIRLFISHCGLGGTEEAIYHGVPILGLPFFGDQPMNAREGENHGYLLKLEWNDLTEQNLLEGIQEVIGNPKYHSNIQRISKIFKDQIDNPLQRGVWWVEYVLRHKGAPQLQSAARDLNYIQYHSLDVIGVYFLLLGLLIYIPCRVLKYVCCNNNAKIGKKEIKE